MAEPQTPRDAAFWAAQSGALKVSDVPQGAVNLNVDGRRTVGPLQGFGQLWQKTYRIRLDGVQTTPEAVIADWKAKFPNFQPKNNRFFPALAGVQPGEIVLINASLSGMPVKTGVMVLYADDTAFTLMTPQGHPESGWVTFSAEDDGGTVVCQVQSMARANDPVYEVGLNLGAARSQEAIWRHVLTALAASYGVSAPVQMDKTCLDQRRQWRQMGNVWQNAAIRSVFYSLGAPLRWVHPARPRSEAGTLATATPARNRAASAALVFGILALALPVLAIGGLFLPGLNDGAATAIAFAGLGALALATLAVVISSSAARRWARQHPADAGQRARMAWGLVLGLVALAAGGALFAAVALGTLALPHLALFP
jgi:hypothetical protein